MNLEQVELQGTLQEDGTLVLDEKPKLPPGRVEIVLRQVAVSPSPRESWWQFMQRSRRELEAAGYPFMNDEEMQAHIDWLREGDPVDDLLQQVEKKRQSQE